MRFTVDCTDITWSHLLNDIMCILVSPSVTSVCVFYHVQQLCFIIKSIVIHITDYVFTPTNKNYATLVLFNLAYCLAKKGIIMKSEIKPINKINVTKI